MSKLLSFKVTVLDLEKNVKICTFDVPILLVKLVVHMRTWFWPHPGVESVWPCIQFCILVTVYVAPSNKDKLPPILARLSVYQSNFIITYLYS